MAPEGYGVEVWRVDLRAAPAGVQPLDDERQRAERMRDERQASHLLASRAWLRAILGRHLDRDPAALRFSLSARGKPSVVDGGDLCFSLSRSDGAALIAVTRGRPVGVDVERVRADLDHDGVLLRFFAPGEADAVRRLPVAERANGFLALWVRKEAVVKASGAGLDEGLDLIGVRDDPVAGRWSVASVEPGPGYVGAVAVDGLLGPVRLHDAG